MADYVNKNGEKILGGKGGKPVSVEEQKGYDKVNKAAVAKLKSWPGYKAAEAKQKAVKEAVTTAKKPAAKPAAKPVAKKAVAAKPVAKAAVKKATPKKK
jgi:hypothetical protein